MQSIKLAFVTQFPIDINRPLGGVEAVSVNLVRALAKSPELDIHVVTLCPDTKQNSVERYEQVTVHRLAKPPGSELFNAINKSKRLVVQYVTALGVDLIHAHDTYGIMVKDVPIAKIFTVHGFIYSDTLLANGRFKRLRAKLWEFVEKGCWARQPYVIAISPYVRERLSAVSNATIYDIDNPISNSFFQLSRNEQIGTIFTSAVICPRKNTLQLVKATGLLVAIGMDVRLRIAGSITDDAYAQELAAYISEHHLEKHITLLGRISTQEVQDELSRASVYALVSLEENSPMGIEEAMAAGVPVVTSNRCGMPYMVKHGETGYLVNPFNEKDIASKLKLILASKARKDSMSKKAKIQALDLYHADSVARRTLAVYQDILINDQALA